VAILILDATFLLLLYAIEDFAPVKNLVRTLLQTNRKLWEPAFLALLGISGISLLVFTNRFLAEWRSVRTLHLVPELLKELDGGRTYLVFISITGLFHTSQSGYRLDTWLAIGSSGGDARLVTLSDMRSGRYIQTIRGGKANMTYRGRTTSFIGLHKVPGKDAARFIGALSSLKDGDRHPEFPGTLIKEEYFRRDTDKYRNFDMRLAQRMVAELNEMEESVVKAPICDCMALRKENALYHEAVSSGLLKMRSQQEKDYVKTVMLVCARCGRQWKFTRCDSFHHPIVEWDEVAE
jgi:hypothetical protein